MEYNFREIEQRWQKYWSEKKTFKTENKSGRPKYYVLDMFPYPSGAGLHVGHPLGYIASDIVARYKRLKGFNVLHPMGYDAFGLPAEQYAIQTGQHPAITTEQNIARYRQQLDKIGFSFDWDREVRTSDPAYYKWTQWIFIQLFNSWYNKNSNKAEPVEVLISIFEKSGNANINAVSAETEQFSAEQWKALSEKQQQVILLDYRLAYLSDTMVNWCPSLGTVLANEEVKEGVSERGGYPVVRKLMKQWSLRITAYADRLLNDLDALDWTDSIKEAQRNWIGKSEGTTIEFRIQNSEFRMEVFTTRPDTIFGVSFVTLAPEHELVDKITTSEFKNAVVEYVTYAKNRSERDRMSEVKNISGQFTGAYVIHPFTGANIPIWIGDYVLAGYGTGAVMAVPGHDTRDYAFAKKFELSITEVVSGGDLSKEAHDAKEGKMLNSDFLNGLDVKVAINRAIEEIEKRGLGKRKINFRLRDAIFSRQRYWGEPFPVYYKDGMPYMMDEKELPLLLPEVDKYLPTETGEPPLARANNWKTKEGYPLETNTMPGWAGSSWYFLRYMDAHNDEALVSKEAVNYWQEVDLYIGGSEHATGHLLYVRFWTKFLFDLGLIPKQEPAKKLINQGMIQGVSEFYYIKNGFSNFNLGILFSPTSDFRLPNELCNRRILFSNENVENAIDYLKKQGDSQNKIDDFIKREINVGGNIDISLVENSILNIEKFIEWRKEFKDAVFVCKEGYLVDGKFISFNSDEIKIPVFKTFSEVEKMSKSKWNVVSPDDIVEQHGADTLRLYEMFLGPLEQSKPWSTNGINGVSNFLKKLWRLYHTETNDAGLRTQDFLVSDEAPTKAELKSLHKIIKKVQEDIERFSFNTSVSNFMICVNELTDLQCNKRAILEPLAILISPYAPHIAEMLWAMLKFGKDVDLSNIPSGFQSITYAEFPEFKAEYLVEDFFDYPISFNGKMRFKVGLPLSLTISEIEKEVMSSEEVIKWMEGKTPKKVIIVPHKIVNIVL